MALTVPSTDEIREILVRRVDQQKQAIGIIVGTGMFLFVPIVAGQWQLLVAIVAGVGAALVMLFID